MRISTGAPGFHSLPPPTSTAAKKAEPEVSIEQTLFGTVRPKPLDLAAFPHLAERMRWLNKQKLRIAAFFGDHDSEYEISLCEGMNACIDPDGRIYIGERLMTADPALLTGVLAHEIGHRPKGWKKMTGLKREAMMELARKEEAKADHAAGRALAALELSAEPLCNFLVMHGHFEKQPENYYEVGLRVEIIREAYAAQKARKTAAKNLFPAFAQATDVKHLVQDGSAAPVQKKKRRLGRSV